MADRQYESKSNIILEFYKKINPGRAVSQEKFVEKMDSMLDRIANELDQGVINSNNLQEKSPVSGSLWGKIRGNLINDYKLTYILLNNITQEEKTIIRMERKLHRQALIFRFFTTLAIGCAVMIIYGIANCLGIDMPLMKIP